MPQQQQAAAEAPLPNLPTRLLSKGLFSSHTRFAAGTTPLAALKQTHASPFYHSRMGSSPLACQSPPRNQSENCCQGAARKLELWSLPVCWWWGGGGGRLACLFFPILLLRETGRVWRGGACLIQQAALQGWERASFHPSTACQPNNTIPTLQGRSGVPLDS